MKKFIKKYLLEVIFSILAAILGSLAIVYTLTFKEIPPTDINYWYAVDLHTYLLWRHLFIFLATLLIVSAVWIVEVLYDKLSKD